MHVDGSTELRPRLGQHPERAKDGDDVVVLVHGHPAALLRGFRPDDIGALVPSHLMRDELHKPIRKARATPLAVTWHWRMFALPPGRPERGDFELKEWRARRDSNPRPSDPKSASRWDVAPRRFVRRTAIVRTPFSTIPG